MRSVLQCVAVCCSALQCVAVCCSVLRCVAVCCSVLQHAAHQHADGCGVNVGGRNGTLFLFRSHSLSRLLVLSFSFARNLTLVDWYSLCEKILLFEVVVQIAVV